MLTGAAGLDQLKRWPLILAAVAQIAYPHVLVRLIAQAHDVHAEEAGIKISRFRLSSG